LISENGEWLSLGRKPKADRFIHSIPLDWVLKVCREFKYPNGAVIALLWYVAGVTGTDEFEVYPQTREMFGISRMKLKRWLDDLQRAGLVKLNRNGNRTIIRLLKARLRRSSKR
jgi:hypothetical protein